MTSDQFSTLRVRIATLSASIASIRSAGSSSSAPSSLRTDAVKIFGRSSVSHGSVSPENSPNAAESSFLDFFFAAFLGSRSSSFSFVVSVGLPLIGAFESSKGLTSSSSTTSASASSRGGV